MASNGQTPGNTLHFDATNDYVSTTVPAHFSDLVTNDFTIEAWVYPQTAAFSRIVFAQYSSSSFASLSTGSGNNIYFYVVAGGTNYSISTTATIPLNQWTHVSARWTAATLTPEVFFNGVLQAGGSGGSSTTGTAGILSIGSRPDGYQYFSGMIDEIRIWETARTDCEIVMNYSKTLSAADTSLICYYDFDQGVAAGSNSAVTTLPDLCGVYNGTLNNFALTGSSSNWLASTAGISGIGTGLGYQMYYDTAEVCSGASYTFADGYTENNITSPISHVSTFQSSLLCDSMITTYVNTVIVDTAVIQTSAVLTASGSGTYQWLDCNNAYSELTGETNQIFNATVNGSYAVEISSAGCIDTSYCFEINNIGIDENAFGPAFIVYPNPGNGHFTVDLGADYTSIFITVSDISGQEIKTLEYNHGQLLQIDIEDPAGTYFIHIVTAEKETVVRLLKQ